MQMSKTGSLERQTRAGGAGQVAELQKTVEERDKLLAEARAEEAMQQSAGAAVALFYGVNPRAQESGVAFAHPAEDAVRAYLYGLAAPPEGQEYAVAARTEGRRGEAARRRRPRRRRHRASCSRGTSRRTPSQSSSSSRRPAARRVSRAPSRGSRRAIRGRDGDRGVLVEAPRRRGAGARSAPAYRPIGARVAPVSAPVSAPVEGEEK